MEKISKKHYLNTYTSVKFKLLKNQLLPRIVAVFEYYNPLLSQFIPSVLALDEKRKTLMMFQSKKMHCTILSHYR